MYISLIKLINSYSSWLWCGWWTFNLTVYCDIFWHHCVEPSYTIVEATSQQTSLSILNRSAQKFLVWCNLFFPQEKTKYAQFIIISHQSDMLELANKLMGIFKTLKSTQFMTTNPKSFGVVASQGQLASQTFSQVSWVILAVKGLNILNQTVIIFCYVW